MPTNDLASGRMKILQRWGDLALRIKSGQSKTGSLRATEYFDPTDVKLPETQTYNGEISYQYIY